jgi:hypothetical protein
MGYDRGDVDNDGVAELFATDMKPRSADAEILAHWEPVLSGVRAQTVGAEDRQIMENVMQRRGPDGQYHNDAVALGVDATGWSWSGKFGDLDQDGYLDLYVVNGMVAGELFGQLLGGALVEANVALRNQGGEQFVEMPEWDLGAITSGRGMSMADLDGDGDLDIVVNNLNAPAQLFENQLCAGASLQVDLRHLGAMNTRALGATARLITSTGTYWRDVRAVSGYLSGDPSRLHFGFPATSRLQSLEITWPDGEITRIDAAQFPVNSRILVTRM